MVGEMVVVQVEVLEMVVVLVEGLERVQWV